jgi:hypothetical protein
MDDKRDRDGVRPLPSLGSAYVWMLTGKTTGVMWALVTGPSAKMSRTCCTRGHHSIASMTACQGRRRWAGPA